MDTSLMEILSLRVRKTAKHALMLMHASPVQWELFQ